MGHWSGPVIGISWTIIRPSQHQRVVGSFLWTWGPLSLLRAWTTDQAAFWSAYLRPSKLITSHWPGPDSLFCLTIIGPTKSSELWYLLGDRSPVSLLRTWATDQAHFTVHWTNDPSPFQTHFYYCRPAIFRERNRHGITRPLRAHSTKWQVGPFWGAEAHPYHHRSPQPKLSSVNSFPGRPMWQQVMAIFSAQ